MASLFLDLNFATHRARLALLCAGVSHRTRIGNYSRPDMSLCSVEPKKAKRKEDGKQSRSRVRGVFDPTETPYVIVPEHGVGLLR